MKKICYVLTVPITVRAFFIPQLQYLTKNGYEITVICSEDSSLQKELGNDIKYISLNMPRGIAVVKSISAIRALYKIMKSEKYDLVQYSTPNAAFYSSIASKLAGIKVRNYHLMGFRYLGAGGIGKNVLKCMEKLSCQLSTHIECVSNSNLELGIRERLFKRKKAIVIGKGSTGGVNLQKYDISQKKKWRKEIREQLGLQADDFVYGFVGRITKDKGVNELLEAYFQLNNGSKLLFVGDIERQDTINQDLLERAYHHPDILFHQSVKDVEKYYSAMDVLVLPSYREGFGAVIIEAASMGVPAIITDIPGPVDAVIPEITAKLVSVKDSEQLGKAMLDIKESDVQKMGEEASLFARTYFDSDVLCQKILERKQMLLE